jgi:hypothetical protein
MKRWLKKLSKIKRILKNREVWGRGDDKIKVENEEVTGKGDITKMKSWHTKQIFLKLLHLEAKNPWLHKTPSEKSELLANARLLFLPWPVIIPKLLNNAILDYFIWLL